VYLQRRINDAEPYIKKSLEIDPFAKAIYCFPSFLNMMKGEKILLY